MRRILMLGIGVSLCIIGHAQETASMVLASGAVDVEALNADEYERWSDLLANPIAINSVPEARLAASGLFSPFQIASIIDYRARHGDILSALELAQLDGFNEEKVARLRPFLRFDGSLGPAPATGLHGEVLGPISSSLSEGATKTAWKAKARLSYGERISAAWSPGGSRYLSLSGIRRPWRLVLGDYKARFGQGLALWSGFSIAGVGTPSALARTSSGITPAWSWSEGNALQGLAAEARLGRLRTSGFFSWNAAPTSAVNLTLLLRRGQLGTTVLRREKAGGEDGQLLVSADCFYGWRSVEFFGETAWDVLPKAMAAVGGLRFPAGGRIRGALAARYYPAQYSAPLAGALRSGTKITDEAGLSLSGEYASERRQTLRGVTGFGNSVSVLRILLTADALRTPSGGKRQLKLLLRGDWQISDTWSLQTQLGERLREGYNTPDNRSELRTDLRWSDGRRISTTRFHLLHSRGTGFLCYQEAGLKTERLSVYARGTLFYVGHWDDRIYAYERDTPGSFSVPAFSGDGFKLSAIWQYKWAVRKVFHIQSALRVSYLSYFPSSPKPGKLEFKAFLKLSW